MYLFMIPLLFAFTTASQTYDYYSKLNSAASDSQIKFAIENKYDDTGPGAKGREYAYNTYKNLEDALVGYIDDPDTKLPEFEKAIGTQKLLNSQKHYATSTGFVKRPIISAFYEKPGKTGFWNYKGQWGNPFKLTEKLSDPLRVPKYTILKNNPINLGHYAREQSDDFYNPNPQYEYSYNVHDRKTGDSKSAQETRNGDMVTGFYSFKDADGVVRTVQYTANEKEGFKAVVHKN